MIRMNYGTQKFVEILLQIRKRPFMHLYNRQAPYMALVDFINGYFAAMPQGYEADWLDDFDAWIWNSKTSKGLVGDRNLGWQGIIASSYSTEQERFENFFVLFDEYIEQQP